MAEGQLPYTWIIAGAAGALCLAGLLWFLLKMKAKKAATSHVAVEEDDEKIEAELSQLDNLAASVTKITKKPAGAEGETAGKGKGTGKKKGKTEEKEPEKKEEAADNGPKDTPSKEAALKSILKSGKEEKPAAPETKEITIEEKQPGGEEAAEVESEVAWTAEEKEKHRALQEMIAKANLLLSQKETKKAYVLYLKIRREYDNLPKKIQMKIHEEYSGVRSGINRTVPELEIIDDLERGSRERPEKEMEASFLALLDKTDAALGRGERELAFILYSEIKGMYHLVPEGIKKEVYQRCVSIYNRCVGKGG